VSASDARAHIQRLSRQGIGYKLIAEDARVAVSVVYGIRTGERKFCRANTSRAILAVDPKTVIRGDWSLVDGGPTWTLIHELVADGYTKRQLATWLHGRRTLALQIRPDKITYRTATKVQEMYDKVRAGILRRDR
jgi:hypothetical protein